MIEPEDIILHLKAAEYRLIAGEDIFTAHNEIEQALQMIEDMIADEAAERGTYDQSET